MNSTYTNPLARGAAVLKRLPITGIIGLILVVGVVVMALISLVWTPYDPLAAMPADRLSGSTAQHVLGTDRFGRDVFSRILAGSRITLAVGVIAVGISALVGVPLGILAGIRRGIAEAIIMRTSDVVLAFPALLLAVVLGAAFGGSTVTAMVAIGVAGIPGFARVARASTMSVMARDFIAAARSAGRGWPEIAARHVFPNIVGVVIVQASVAFALAILAEAALSFLGLGTPPPDPSWGRMLQDAQASLGSAPQLALWPGLAIALSVLGFNLLGDGLRDALDPRSRRARLVRPPHTPVVVDATPSIEERSSQ